MFDSNDDEVLAVKRYLQWVLDNLEYIQNVEHPNIAMYSDELSAIDSDLSFIPDYGLCDNILSVYLYQREIDAMFESWDGFTGNLMYPCDDRADFIAVDHVNLYLNPKRVSLIKYILECLSKELEARSE